MKQAGADALTIDAGRTLVMDGDAFFAAANAHGSSSSGGAAMKPDHCADPVWASLGSAIWEGTMPAVEHD
jgi:hypothetical protein